MAETQTPTYEHEIREPSYMTWEHKQRTRAMANIVEKMNPNDPTVIDIRGYKWSKGSKIPFQRHGYYMRVTTPSGEVIDTNIDSFKGDYPYKLASLLAWTNAHMQGTHVRCWDSQDA